MAVRHIQKYYYGISPNSFLLFFITIANIFIPIITIYGSVACVGEVFNFEVPDFLGFNPLYKYTSYFAFAVLLFLSVFPKLGKILSFLQGLISYWIFPIIFLLMMIYALATDFITLQVAIDGGSLIALPIVYIIAIALSVFHLRVLTEYKPHDKQKYYYGPSYEIWDDK